MHRGLRFYLVRIGLGAAILLLGFVGWHGVQLWLAWRSFEHVEFDPVASRAALPSIPASPTTAAPEGDEEPGPPPLAILADQDAVDVFLLVGSDEDKRDVDALRADSILLFVWPKDGSDPLLTSLPRDLYLRSPCTGESVRISTTLDGCGEAANGPELLALTVEDFTGLAVDHFAVVSFNGFVDIVDGLGGIELCVDVMTWLGALILEPGCTMADGTQALSWLRERTAFELVDGEWVGTEAGDLDRVERQQHLILKLLSRLRRFRSPLELSNLVGDLSHAFVLDDGLGLGQAVDLAWDLRRVSPEQIRRRPLAVEDEISAAGEFVRLPAEPFEALLRDVYAAPVG